LPEDGVVFCAFNNLYKLQPEMFDVWMRLLRDVDGSVLWLSQAGETAMRNLKREAQARGVNGERLVFADFVPSNEEHLARLSLADLFLDTLPYNAHAGGCDALWAGVPIVTLHGSTFAGRVGASLVAAAGAPELATESLAGYEALARDLVTSPGALVTMKAKLAAARATCPLFDTARFTRNLEAAYRIMAERQQHGETKASFAVTEPASRR
jgi:predicted O-linked N-acetylglucosamine transferase (SPINDLY family)